MYHLKFVLVFDYVNQVETLENLDISNFGNYQF